MADQGFAGQLPGAGLAMPLVVGGTRLREVDLGPCASVMPFHGQRAEVDRRLAEIDAGLADIGRSQAAQVWSTWMGRNLWFIWGADPADLTTRLNGAAAVTEQTDGWVIFDLTGADAVAVLARLTPLDLHPDIFPPGTSARTDLAHMAASVTALGEGFRIMAMRSFAGTLMHDLEAAMRSVAGQRDIL